MITSINDVNVEELIRSHCDPKLSIVREELLKLTSDVASKTLEYARLLAHSQVQKAFDSMSIDKPRAYDVTNEPLNYQKE